jgi:nitroreductase
MQLSALDYHRLTNHGRGRIDDPRLVRGYRMQLDRKPPEMKAYPSVDAEPVPDELDALLFLSAGVVRVKDHPQLGRMSFRAAGSAGNLQPLEVYVVHHERVLHYEPRTHEVKAVGRAPAGPTTLVVTGVPWRTGWKYTERGFRHLYWDCGTMLSQLLAAAPAPRLQLGFVDAEVAALVGADLVHEHPLAVVVLGEGEPDLRPVAPAVAGVLDVAPMEFPVVTASQRAGDLASPTEVAAWRRADATAPAPADVTFGLSLADVVRRRGSTREFDPSVSAPGVLLVNALAAATAPLHSDAGPTTLRHDVLVHDVEGWEPGAYRWSPETATLEPLEAHTDTRLLGRQLCLGQPLGGDGCFTAFHQSDIETLVRPPLGDRAYRCAQLEAGVVEGRLHLAAYALGFGATGLTFVDEAVRETFRTPAWPMLVTAVGKPTYRSTPGGDPGHPAVLRG